MRKSPGATRRTVLVGGAATVGAVVAASAWPASPARANNSAQVFVVEDYEGDANTQWADAIFAAKKSAKPAVVLGTAGEYELTSPISLSGARGITIAGQGTTATRFVMAETFAKGPSAIRAAFTIDGGADATVKSF